MNNIMIITLLINFIIIFTTLIEKIYTNNKYRQKYKSINNFISTNLKNIYIRTKDGYDTFLLETNKSEITGYNTNILIYNNKKMIRQAMKMSYHLFSQIYNDKKIYCSIRVRKENDTFLTIAHIKNLKNIKYNTMYTINGNTDLINIYDNRYNIFVICNIDDFKKAKPFILQDKELQENTKAIISIALNDKKRIIGCYSIYFSKPLDDRIEIKKIENVFTNLNKSLSNLVKTYIETSENDLLELDI